MPEQLTEEQLFVLMDLVTLAKTEQIKTVADLKRRAEAMGCAPADIDAACDFWRDDLRERYPDFEDLRTAKRPGIGPEPRVFPQTASRVPLA